MNTVKIISPTSRRNRAGEDREKSAEVMRPAAAALGPPAAWDSRPPCTGIKPNFIIPTSSSARRRTPESGDQRASQLGQWVRSSRQLAWRWMGGVSSCLHTGEGLDAPKATGSSHAGGRTFLPPPPAAAVSPPTARTRAQSRDTRFLSEPQLPQLCRSVPPCSLKVFPPPTCREAGAMWLFSGPLGLGFRETRCKKTSCLGFG